MTLRAGEIQHYTVQGHAPKGYKNVFSKLTVHQLETVKEEKIQALSGDHMMTVRQ